MRRPPRPFTVEIKSSRRPLQGPRWRSAQSRDKLPLVAQADQAELISRIPYNTDSGRRTRLGFLCGREAGRLVRHESRRQAMARVAGHLSVEDLEAGVRSAREPTAARHFQVIWLLARGHTIADGAAAGRVWPRLGHGGTAGGV